MDKKILARRLLRMAKELMGNIRYRGEDPRRNFEIVTVIRVPVRAKVRVNKFDDSGAPTEAREYQLDYDENEMREAIEVGITDAVGKQAGEDVYPQGSWRSIGFVNSLSNEAYRNARR